MGLPFGSGLIVLIKESVCSPVIRVEVSISVSEQQCRQTWSSPLGEEPLSIPLPELSTKEWVPWCKLSPTVWAHEIHYFGTILGSASTMRMQVISPGV